MDSIQSIDTVGLGKEETERKGQTDCITVNSKQKHNPDHDGGYGWVIVACSFFVFSIVSINSLSFGIFISEFHSTFGWSESELGLVGSLRLGLATIAGKVLSFIYIISINCYYGSILKQADFRTLLS